MASKPYKVLGQKPANRWALYVAKALALVALLLLFCNWAPALPPACIAVAWTVLSVVSSTVLAYHSVVRKAHKQYMFKSGGLVSKVNNGRAFSLLASFVVSMALMAGLVFELPKWALAEWSMVVAAVPLYLVVCTLVKRFLAKELEAPFQTSKAITWSSGILGVLLCAAYLLVSTLEPVTIYANATDAFMAAKQPFGNSPSALMSETGKLVALVDGLTAYGMSKAAEVSVGAYFAWRLAIVASAWFGVASLIGACSLGLRELKLVFSPLDAFIDQDADFPLVKRFLCVAVALPVVSTLVFIVADWKIAETVDTCEYTAFETVVRDHVGLAVYVLDGKYFDQQKVEGLIEEARQASAHLAEERAEVLTPLVNEAYDRRLENVDDYLDWFYSLPADYERLVQYFTGTVESGMRDQLAQRISNGVDESRFAEQFEQFLTRSEALKARLLAELEQYEVDYVPRWLVVPVETFESNFLDKPLKPTQEFLDASERMGLSVSVGAIAGAIATRAAEKAVAKPFFKKAVAELLEKLAVRGFLAEGGTAIAPGVGTAIGLGVGFIADFLFLKADEAMNRESYRNEITDAIEESRQEMLALVGAA